MVLTLWPLSLPMNAAWLEARGVAAATGADTAGSASSLPWLDLALTVANATVFAAASGFAFSFVGLAFAVTNAAWLEARGFAAATGADTVAVAVTNGAWLEARGVAAALGDDTAWVVKPHISHVMCFENIVCPAEIGCLSIVIGHTMVS